MLLIGVAGDLGVNFRFVWFIACWILSMNKFGTGIDDRRREEWVVRIEGGSPVASLLALQSGYKHLGPVSRRIDFNGIFLAARKPTSRIIFFAQKFVKHFNESNNKADIRWELHERLSFSRGRPCKQTF